MKKIALKFKKFIYVMAMVPFAFIVWVILEIMHINTVTELIFELIFLTFQLIAGFIYFRYKLFDV